MLQTTDIPFTADIPTTGYLAWDDADTGKRPGIILFHEGGGTGEHVKERARRLAGLGYAAFCPDMFGAPVAGLEQAMGFVRDLLGNRAKLRTRALGALKAFAEQPQADPARLAAIGFCMGGTTVLEIARSGADVKAVVSFHGGLTFDDPEEAKSIRCKVLVCTGADDPLIPADQRTAFEKQMQATKADWRIHLYGGAGHSFTNREVDAMGYPGFAYNEAADRRSWADMLVLFGEVLA